MLEVWIDDSPADKHEPPYVAQPHSSCAYQKGHLGHAQRPESPKSPRYAVRRQRSEQTAKSVYRHDEAELGRLCISEIYSVTILTPTSMSMHFRRPMTEPDWSQVRASCTPLSAEMWYPCKNE